MPPKRPFHDPQHVILQSRMAVRELDDDDDNDEPTLGIKNDGITFCLGILSMNGKVPEGDYIKCTVN